MTHGVVDALEIIKVNRDQCKLLVALYEVSHELVAGKSVGQPRKPVFYGLIPECLLILNDLVVGYIDD